MKGITTLKSIKEERCNLNCCSLSRFEGNYDFYATNVIYGKSFLLLQSFPFWRELRQTSYWQISSISLYVSVAVFPVLKGITTIASLKLSNILHTNPCCSLSRFEGNYDSLSEAIEYFYYKTRRKLQSFPFWRELRQSRKAFSLSLSSIIFVAVFPVLKGITTLQNKFLKYFVN